jgi:hypothetical protein
MTRLDLIQFLEGTLIPDLKESGTVETAKDFETAVSMLKDYGAALDLLAEFYHGPMRTKMGAEMQVKTVAVLRKGRYYSDLKKRT